MRHAFIALMFAVLLPGMAVGHTGGRIASAAVSYSVNGRQFVAIGSGGGSETEGRLAKLYPDSAGHIVQPASTLFVVALPGR